MKTYNFFIASGLVILLASCETTRQTTDGASLDNASNSNTGISTTSTAASKNSGTTMNSTSPVSASASDPMNNTPAAVSSNETMNANTNTNTSTTSPAASSGTTNQTANTSAVTNNNNQAMNGATPPMTNRKGAVVTAPQNLQSSFSTQFPNASNVQWYQYNSADVPIDWELTGWPALTEKDYAVVYNVGTDPYYGWYDANGNWVGSTSRVSNHSNLPAPVMQLLSSKYAGYTISEVHAETYKNQSGYEIEMAKGTDKIKMVVDANGNILKQKTKMVDANGNVIKDKIKN